MKPMPPAVHSASASLAKVPVTFNPPFDPSLVEGWLLVRLIGDDGDGLCMVTDVTVHGARLICGLDLRVGQPVALSFGEMPSVPAHVRWVRAGVAGIEFNYPVCASALSESGVSPYQRRSSPRFRRCAPAALEWEGRVIVGYLFDLGSDGCCLTVPVPAELGGGAEVSVWIEGLSPKAARVRWLDGGRIGMTFAEPLQMWRLDKLLQFRGQGCQSCLCPDCDRQTAIGSASAR